MKIDIKILLGRALPVLNAILLATIIIVGGWYILYNEGIIGTKEQILIKQLQERAADSKSSGQTQRIDPALFPTAKKDIALTNREIIEKVAPAVVFIETSGGSGTGIIIDKNGYILTNEHVVGSDENPEIKLSDGRSWVAYVVGFDQIIDLAILKVETSSFLPEVKLGDSDSMGAGDTVFTLGYPFGFEGDASFKEGTISRILVLNDISHFEISAEIHPGNSGGPLINTKGEVIGINSAAYSPEKTLKGILVGETIKFAIPINVAKDNLALLKSGERVVASGSPKNISVTEDTVAPLITSVTLSRGESGIHFNLKTN